MTKQDTILAAKALRKQFDAPLQSLKDFIKQLSEALRGDPQLDKELECSGEAIAQAKLSQRDAESAIMRLGLCLKNIGNPTPYGESKLSVESLAQQCYTAYFERTGGKSAVTGNPIPTWEELCDKAIAGDERMQLVREGWIAVASTHPALLYVAPTADGLKL